MSIAKTLLERDETEREFQQAVIDLARTLGWRVAHFRAQKTSKGWRVPVAADGRGYPDLCMIGRGRAVWAELKVGRNKPSPEQEAWLEHLRANGQEAYLWTPDSWDDVVRTLTGREVA